MKRSLGEGGMEILKKLLELISEFLQQRKQSKVEKEEIERVKVDQEEKIRARIEVLKKRQIKPPKKDDFFNDEDSW